MENKKDILKQLANYEVKPPDFLTMKVLDGYAKNHQSYQQFEDSLDKLKKHEVSPPEQLYFYIIKRLGLNRDGKIASFGNPLWWAAAAILIGGAIWFIYPNFLKDSGNEQQLAKDQPKLIQPAMPTAPVISDSHPAAKGIMLYHSYSRNKSSNKTPPIDSLDNQELYMSDIILDGTNYKVKDLEYFVYFTNFKDEEVPPFIRDKQNSRVLLYVDQSTSISISPAMIKMMRKLYSTKGNGTSTKRAIRIKKKMDKWKQADEVYFDRNIDKNPMNPIDLGNFILN